MHGTPEQKRKLIRECLTGESESSSEDEFQKEMEAELNCTMKDMEGKWKSQLEGQSCAEHELASRQMLDRTHPVFTRLFFEMSFAAGVCSWSALDQVDSFKGCCPPCSVEVGREWK